MLKKILSLGCFLIMIASVYSQKTISTVDSIYNQASSKSASSGNNLMNQQARILIPRPPTNLAPTNIAITASALNENVVSNSSVGTLSSTDADAGNTFTYTLVAGDGSTDNAAFTISGASLQINSSPDFETKSSYSVRVRTTDQGSLYYEKSFTITINDLNEAPTNLALSASSINENVTANSTVGNWSTTDLDSANTFTYTLVSGDGSTDNAAFTISGASLQITSSPDFETKASYSVRVRTTDQGGLYYEKSFTITINDLIETPPVVAPVLSYASATHVFPINTAITPLEVTNTGGAITSIPGSVSTFSQIDGLVPSICIDAFGNQYFTKSNSNEIFKLTSVGDLSTLAGSATQGFLDRTGTSAQFNSPGFLAVDATGNVYVGDQGNYAIRKITASGIVTTLAGGTQGNQDGTGAAAQFGNIIGLAVDATGNVYVADGDNHSIRKITLEGIVTTFAGGTEGMEDGIGTAAKFQTPVGIAIDSSGSLFVTEIGSNSRIRKITAAGVVTTFAGGTSGPADGTGTSAQFYIPVGIAIDPSGTLYVTEYYANSIRKITAAGMVTTLIKGQLGQPGYQDGPLATAQFGYPFGIAVDPSGNLFVADLINSKIRKIILPVEGYAVSPALPTGLVLNAATGSISGTPTTASPATEYTVMASNDGGNGTFKLNITVKPLAPTATAQTFCGSKTVADLAATGTNLKWYAAATGGTSLDASTTLATGTYYVSQTLNSSESDRTSVAVTVNNSVAGTVSAGQLIVRGTQPAPISLTGSSGSVQWQSSLDNSTFTNIVGATSTTLTSSQMGILTKRRFYRAIIKSGDCSSVTSEVVQVWTTLETKVQDSQCGQTLANLSYSVTADYVPGADKYRFKVVNGATTRTFETSARGFSLTSLEGGALYNTSYSISVATQSIGLWSDYGPQCTIITPSGLTKIQDTQCGTTLAALNTLINANSVYNVSNYRFKVVQGATTRILESSNRGFSLTSLEGGVLYNTQYTVSVATKYNGVWGDYGTECKVTTPSGQTKIQNSQCGTVLASLNTNVIANEVAGVTNYRFKVVANGETRTLETATRYFILTSLQGGALYNTQYTVNIATKYNGVWGEYGTECTVTTPTKKGPTVSKLANTTSVKENVLDAVSIIAYPNPFTTTFKFDFTSASDSNIDVAVYDMSGKQIDTFQVMPSEINNLAIGNKYPSGVYNVIVTQGTEVKTLRVIKQ